MPGTPTPVELNEPVGVTLNGVPIYTSAVQISWEDDEDAGTGLTWDSQSPLNSTRFSFDLCDGASEGEEIEYRYRGNAFFVNGFTNNETLRDASPYYKNTSFSGNYLAHPQEIDNNGAVHVADSASDVLDEHNGRFCITPDFKNGTYAYFLTYADNNLSTPAYPYIIGTSTKEVRS